MAPKKSAFLSSSAAEALGSADDDSQLRRSHFDSKEGNDQPPSHNQDSYRRLSIPESGDSGADSFSLSSDFGPIASKSFSVQSVEGNVYALKQVGAESFGWSCDGIPTDDSIVDGRQDSRRQSECKESIDENDEDYDEDENCQSTVYWPSCPQHELPEKNSDDMPAARIDSAPKKNYGPLSEEAPAHVERPAWWKFGRRASVSSQEGSPTKNNGEKHNNPHGPFGKSENDCEQQWWQFPRRMTNEGAATSLRKNENESPPFFGLRRNLNQSNGAKSTLSSDDNGGLDHRNEVKNPIQNLRASLNSSTSGKTDEELDRLLFPRRGTIQGGNFNARGSLISSNSGMSSNTMSTRNGVDLEGPFPDDSQGNAVEAIVDKMKQNSITISPLDRALLHDMVTTKKDRWKRRVSFDSSNICSSESGYGSQESVRKLENGRSKSDSECSAVRMLNDAQDPPQQRKETDSTACNDSCTAFNQSNLSAGDWSYSVTASDEAQILLPTKAQHDNIESNLESSPPEVSKSPSNEPKSPGMERSDTNNTFDTSEWNSKKLCQVKDGVSLSKVRAIDDVSSIASSDHSGHLVLNEKSSDTPRRKTAMIGSSRRSSFAHSFGWNKITVKTETTKSAASTLDEYDDEEHDLEGEIFAAKDAKRASIVKEACELMDSVNKSVVAMGMDAPFRPMEEVCPFFKKLHKNLRYQMDSLHVNLSTINRAKSHGSKSAKKKSSDNLNFTESGMSYSTPGNFDLSELDDEQKAIASYILKQMTKSQFSSNFGSSLDNPTEKSQASKLFSAYLPNFMWYQSSAADPSSVIRPTSLCSGTCISGGHQYLQPEMLSVFNMFGSYFVGAFGSFPDDEGDKRNRRSAFWMESIGEDDEVSEVSKSSDDSLESELDDNINREQQIDPQTQIEILEKALNELRRSQNSNTTNGGRQSPKKGAENVPLCNSVHFT